MYLASDSSYQPRRLLIWVLKALEKVYVTASLVLLTGAFGIFLGPQSADNSDGSQTMQLLFLVMYAVALGLILVRPAHFMDYVRAEKALGLVVLLALLSIAWATNPELTARRSVALAGTTLFGAYLASRFSIHELLRLVGWAFIIVIASSILSALVIPGYGIMREPHAGAWRGVFSHKNALGRAMALGAIVLSLLANKRPLREWLFSLSAIVAVLTVFYSQSASSFVVLIACVIAIRLLPTLRSHSSAALFFVLFGLLIASSAAVLFVVSPMDLLGLLGRDPSLTGRTELWQLAMTAVTDRPWFGYGYSSFWLGWSGPSAEIWARLNWEPPHAHNGVIDMLLNLGVIGLALFVTTITRALSYGVEYYRTNRSRYAAWPIAFFMFLVLTNLSENTFLGRNDLFWVLQVALTLQLAVVLRRHPFP